jgi:hypothetical protein
MPLRLAVVATGDVSPPFSRQEKKKRYLRTTKSQKAPTKKKIPCLREECKSRHAVTKFVSRAALLLNCSSCSVTHMVASAFTCSVSSVPVVTERARSGISGTLHYLSSLCYLTSGDTLKWGSLAHPAVALGCSRQSNPQALQFEWHPRPVERLGKALSGLSSTSKL